MKKLAATPKTCTLYHHNSVMVDEEVKVDLLASELSSLNVYPQVKMPSSAFLKMISEVDRKKADAWQDSSELSDTMNTRYMSHMIFEGLSCLSNKQFPTLQSIEHIGIIDISVRNRGQTSEKTSEMVHKKSTDTTTKRWQILQANINFVEYSESHSTILLIDRDSLIIEEFDPLGTCQENEFCYTILENWCGKHFPDFYFCACKTFCPGAGPQGANGSKSSGACWLLCIFWILTRVSSDLVGRKELVDYLNDMQRYDFLDDLLIKAGIWIIDSLESIGFSNTIVDYTK